MLDSFLLDTDTYPTLTIAQLTRLTRKGADFNAKELEFNGKGLRDCGSLEEECRGTSLPTAIQALA